MTSLRSIRLDAGEYGTVIETEGVLPDGLQLDFNRGLRPIEALKSLESLAMVRGMTTRLSPLFACWLAEPRPGIMTRLEDLTINRATPAQLVRPGLLPAAAEELAMYRHLVSAQHYCPAVCVPS